VKSVLFVCMGNICLQQLVSGRCCPCKQIELISQELLIENALFDPDHSLEQRILDEQFL